MGLDTPTHTVNSLREKTSEKLFETPRTKTNLFFAGRDLFWPARSEANKHPSLLWGTTLIKNSAVRCLKLLEAKCRTGIAVRN